MAKKSWAEKMLRPEAPVVEVLDKSGNWGKLGDKMLIPTPVLVKAEIDGLNIGESLSSSDLRERLAAGHGADFACPLTTGIFLRIVSEAAWDEHLAGAPLEAVTPFWRAVEPKSPLSKKLACGQEFVAQMRESEGIG
ncbi:MAG: hypothetical protein ACKVQS_02850 [Fimbriimonadaceae bacterium]